MKRALLSLSLFAAAVSAQAVPTTATVPNVLATVNVDRPFSGGIGRYQQWYSAASLQASISEPMRINRLEFFAGLPPTSIAATIDCEILMGHGKFSGVLGSFDSNWDTPGGFLIVRSRTNVPLVAATTGSVCMDIPLPTQFTWDRTRPLLIEIRVYGNSQGNNPFNYNFRGSTTSIGTISRVYAGGSVGATNGVAQQGVGMVTRFSARPGINLTYGTGCAGEGGFVPAAAVQNLAWPGVVWNHQLSNAASQRACIWTIGDIDATPLQLDLTALLGLPPSGCLLRNNFINTVGLVTVGGGAGGGSAALPLQLPPTTNYVGFNLYTQWVLLDPLSPNGIFSVSNGNRSIVAPVGG